MKQIFTNECLEQIKDFLSWIYKKEKKGNFANN